MPESQNVRGPQLRISPKFVVPVACVALASAALLGHVNAAASALHLGAAAGHLTVAQPVVSIYPPTTVPADPAENDGSSVELGVKFSVSTPGVIRAIKYYKSSTNKGSHTATLWSAGGSRLATATFSDETSTGWQTANLSNPVTVTAGASYVASYHTSTGHYAQLQNAFAAGKTTGNSYLKATGASFSYGSSRFPRDTWRNSAYFVDVLFQVNAEVVPGPSGSAVSSPATRPTNSSPAPAPSSSTVSVPPSTSSAPSSSAPHSSAPSTSSAPSSSPAAPPPGQMMSPPAAGVPAGVTLTAYTGPSTITKDGTVIDAKDITVSLEIAAKNVVISRSRIHTTSDEDVHVSGSLTISESTLSGPGNGIGGDNYTAVRVEVTKLADDGFKLGDNVHVDQSWCHDMTPTPQAHADCGQMQAGVTNMSVTNSWFDGGRNSALFIAPDLGPSSSGPVLISNNVLGNGNYTLYCVDGNNGQYFVKNITITNNRFLNTSQYGPMTINVPVTASNNTWFSTGKPIN